MSSGAETIDAVVALHTQRVVALVPGATTQLSGSALLGHAEHDIDLVVLVSDVGAAAARLREAYPPLYPDEWRDDWAAFREPGPPQVDLVVTRPGTKGDAHHRRAWELLLGDERLRAEYERLRVGGMSAAEKAAFFERVVASLDD